MSVPGVTVPGGALAGGIVPGVDLPLEDAEAEVTPVLRGISVPTRVEVAAPALLVVRPVADLLAERPSVREGDRVEVVWNGPTEGRALPAEVVETEDRPARWHLRITGPAERSQRRKAVRARVTVPLRTRIEAVDLAGETVDLSEAGTRAMLDGWGLPPEPGATGEMTLEFEDGPITTRAEVLRLQPRGARWLTSFRFLDLSEKDRDVLRRRVFQGLREERARDSN
ncbi:MAG TPA: PilZ domain-containing protein [Geodermatophilus sp.]|nr:PilZ domain-containing protein [Geodermatophilus sp.]